MKTIYLVTAGEYSDYGVVAAFSTREQAEAAIADGVGEEVEELELDPERPPLPLGMKAFQGWMRRDGNSSKATLSDPYDSDYKIVWPTVVTFYPYGGQWGNEVHYKCWARDEQHAVKIANEKRVQLIANNEWPVPRPVDPRPNGLTIAITREMIFTDGAKSPPEPSRTE